MPTSPENTEQPSVFHLLRIQSKTSLGERRSKRLVQMWIFNLKVITYGNKILFVETEKPKRLDSLAHSVSEHLLFDQAPHKGN